MSGGNYRPRLNLPRPLMDNILDVVAVAGLLGMAMMVRMSGRSFECEH